MALPSRFIKDRLVDLLTGLELDGAQAFTEVVGHNEGEFDSYPSIRVLPGDQTTEKSSTRTNERTPAYIVRTTYPVKKDGSHFDIIYDRTDLIIDKLDEADGTSAINLSGFGISVVMINATRGDWYEAPSQSGPLMMCDVNVEVRYSKPN